MKRIFSILLILFLVLSSFALAEETTYEPTVLDIALGGRVISEEETHITVGNTTRVDGMFFTSQFGNNTSDIDVRNMLHGYSPVVWSTQLDFVTDPTVVKDMTASADRQGNTTYTLTLQEDLAWNDGTPITAADYVFSYLLQASPAFRAIGANTDKWNYIVGYDAYAAGETDGLKGVRLLDDYRFSLTVKGEFLPYFYELSLLYVEICPISVIAPGCTVEDSASGAVVRDADGANPLFTAEVLKTTLLDPATGYLSHPMLTSGPYSLVSYDRASGTVEFRINEYYKGNHEGVKPVITTVTLVPVTPADAAEKLESGEVGLVNKAVSSDMINSLLELRGNGVSIGNYARLGYGYISFAANKGPQQFQAVRQAIAYAFDTDTFVAEYFKGYALPVYGYYGIGQWMTQAAINGMRPEDLTEAQTAEWEAQSLDGLNHYDYNLDEALRLLIEDGWTLNRTGKDFDPARDTVRYKSVEGNLMRLSFTFGKTIGNAAADKVAEMLQESFQYLGAELIVKEDTFANILADYQRTNIPRKYDLSIMAYNFVSIFDPLMEFDYTSAGPARQNLSGIMDKELRSLASELHKTQPGDALSFLKRWISFQERYNALLPSLPLYSNVYFDAYTQALKNYYPSSESSWPNALLYAYIDDSEPAQTETGEEFFESDDGAVEFED